MTGGGDGYDDDVYLGTIWVFANISGMITFFSDGTINSINNNFALTLFGYTASELEGKVCSYLLKSKTKLLQAIRGTAVVRLLCERLALLREQHQQQLCSHSLWLHGIRTRGQGIMLLPSILPYKPTSYKSLPSSLILDRRQYNIIKQLTLNSHI